jgi:hypothetical protein
MIKEYKYEYFTWMIRRIFIILNFIVLYIERIESYLILKILMRKNIIQY